MPDSHPLLRVTRQIRGRTQSAATGAGRIFDSAEDAEETPRGVYGARYIATQQP